MKTIAKVLLRGLMVVFPIVITVAVLWWLAVNVESLFAKMIPPEVYFPGMGAITGLALVFVVGILTSFWLFRALFNWGERLLNRIPLVKTLYSSVKDLMGFFPGAKKEGPGFKQAVIANVGGYRILGVVTRDDFSDLPEALHGNDEVLVYFPMSYQLGGFTVWVPRSAVTAVELSVSEAMRFAITGGMSTGDAEGEVEDSPGTKALPGSAADDEG